MDVAEIKNNIIQTRPIKGTTSRGSTKKADQLKKDILTNSAKDKAELMMITDLLRNDLGKICQYGTVQVRKLREIEKYADSLIRKPHSKNGRPLTKTGLMLPPSFDEETYRKWIRKQ